MTKDEFQAACYKTTGTLMNALALESAVARNTRAKQRMASRKFRLYADLRFKWETEGFWTLENIIAYDLLCGSHDNILG